MNKTFFKNFNKMLMDKKGRKRLITILLGIFLILYLISFASPKIYLEAQIKSVTDKDYDIFLKNNDGIPLEDKLRENCRLFSIRMQLKNPFLIARNVKVNKVTPLEYLQEKVFLDKTADEFHNLGSYFATNNTQETHDAIDVYLKDITDEKLENFFGDYKIEISWVDLLNRKHKEYYYLKDYFE